MRWEIMVFEFFELHKNLDIALDKGPKQYTGGWQIFYGISKKLNTNRTISFPISWRVKSYVQKISAAKFYIKICEEKKNFIFATKVKKFFLIFPYTITFELIGINYWKIVKKFRNGVLEVVVCFKGS